MGKQNRQRRAAKAKKREQARAQQGAQGRRSNARTGFDGDRRRDGEGSPRGDGPLFTKAEIARNILALAAMGRFEQIGPRDPTATEALMALPERIVDRAVEECFLDQVSAIWEGGWQPVELHRQAKRGTSSAAAARLIAAAIAADHVDRPEESLDPRWRDQIEALDLPPLTARHGWFAAWQHDEGLSRTDGIERALNATECVSTLRILKPLLPLPGIDGGPPRQTALGEDLAAASASDPVLDRVRGLLAKAESTTFDAEAEAFTAKAHELITRHAIDTALLHAERGADDRPVMIRVPIDPPYVDGKSLLLHAVAEATRCRVVRHTHYDLATIAGFSEDVNATELLFTSLLVQAQAALAESARGAEPGSRVRRPGYRAAFYLSYADRIGDRLDEINRHLVGEADTEAGTTGGPSVLPILRSREATVDEFIDETFGELTFSPVRRGYDAAGWGHGRVAADQAQLDFGDLDDGRTDAERGAASSGDGPSALGLGDGEREPVTDAGRP